VRGGKDTCAGAVVAGCDDELEHGDYCKRELGDFGNLRVHCTKIPFRIRISIRGI
jgi:hypothetical protein